MQVKSWKKAEINYQMNANQEGGGGEGGTPYINFIGGFCAVLV